MGQEQETHKDQSYELQKLIQDVDIKPSENNLEDEANNDDLNIQEDIDVLNLPPRKDVHKMKSRIHFKMSKAFLRFMFVVLIIVIILIGTYYYVGEDFLNLFN